MLHLKEEFPSVELFEGISNLLFIRENLALTLHIMSRMTNILLCKVSCARKVTLSVDQPIESTV